MKLSHVHSLTENGIAKKNKKGPLTPFTLPRRINIKKPAVRVLFVLFT